MSTISHMQQELQLLEEHSNLRRLPRMVHDGRDVIVNGKRMLNLSSNDYLGLASDRALREEFLRTLTPDTFLSSALVFDMGSKKVVYIEGKEGVKETREVTTGEQIQNEIEITGGLKENEQILTN